MSNFILLGAAGFVAPRHMQAIKDTGNDLLAAMDKTDSVGIIDSYFPNADFFTEFERFDRHVDLLKRKGKAIEYCSVCSPNYLHDSHIRFSLRSGADAICEKPLVLNPWNIDALAEVEQETGKTVNTILQLRLHDSVIKLKNRIKASGKIQKVDVDLTYITSRGKWYSSSWKGDDSKSGGIATNIGVHFFDMLHFVFGALQSNQLHFNSPTTSAGFLEYEHARVRWFLSIDRRNLPSNVASEGKSTFRNITIDDESFEFSGGFTDLHTRSYEQILKGKGFGLEENRASIETVAALRNMKPDTSRGELHPAVLKLT